MHYWLLLFFLSCLPAAAQDYSYLNRVWNVGYPRSYVRFEGDTITTHTPPPTPYGAIASTSNVCSPEGNYLFSINGTEILDSTCNVIDNGDYLTDNYFYWDMSGVGTGGFQVTAIIPKRDNQWYAFNYSVSDSVYEIQSTRNPNRLYYSVVDMNANGGAGRVISKRNLAYAGDMGDCRMTGTRHGNGRDWWLVVHGYNNNEYYTFLVSPDTITGPYVQAIGDSMFEMDALGQAKFSADGTLYASATANSNVVILDFDRCSGVFSNPRSIKYYPEPPYDCGNGSTNCSGIQGLCFSPSKRYLYLNMMVYIHQIDLESANPDSSRVLLAIRDSTWSDWGPFNQQYLMPNGQIWVAISGSNNIGDKVSVIQYPDSGGLACGFAREHFQIAGCLGAYLISNHLHYELNGNGQCDTPVVINEQQAAVSPLLTPNPTGGEIMLLSGGLSELFVLYDLQGREVMRRALTPGQQQQGIMLDQVPPGMYVYRLQRGGESFFSGKLVVK